MTATTTRRVMPLAVAAACGGLALAAHASDPVAAAAATAQATPVELAAVEPQKLESVVVKGQALRRGHAPYSSSGFDTDQIRDQQVSQLQEMFRWVPGMNVRNYGLGGVADTVTLRGFSGGAHGGDIGYVIDGIPLNEAMSHADGYADLNVVIPLEIDSLTVLRGPVSPLYGNFNRAGVIVIDTRKDGAYRQGDFSVGSNATGDAQVALGARLTADQQLNLAAQAVTTEGFRPQSDAWRATLTGRWTLDVSSTVQLAVSGRVHRGEADSAAYLTPEQFAVDPYGIDPRVRNDGAEKHFGTLRADLNSLINPQLKLLTFAYATRQDFTRYYSRSVSSNPAADWAQREETYDRSVFGAGANLNGQAQLAGGTLNWVGGVEIFRESTDYLYFDGLDNRARVNPAIYDRESTLNSVSAFAEVEAPVHRLFKPTLGLRYDRFSGDCTRNGAETGTEPCGELADLDHISPKVGVRSDVLPGLQLRASWSEGFALPSNFAKYALGAANVDPNVFRQTEFGLAWRVLDSLKADLAWYRLDSSQEIRTVSPGVYENFGSTRRDGLELSLDWSPLDALRVTVIWARADSKVTENANVALLGKLVAGVPETMSTLGVAWAPLAGLGASATVRDVGRYATNATNSGWYDGFTTLDLALTYADRAGGMGYRAYLRVDNVLDRVYATNVSTTYAPGAPRTLRVGAQLDF
jgi:iron complex outermembrane receptor protein